VKGGLSVVKMAERWETVMAEQMDIQLAHWTDSKMELSMGQKMAVKKASKKDFWKVKLKELKKDL